MQYAEINFYPLCLLRLLRCINKSSMQWGNSEFSLSGIKLQLDVLCPRKKMGRSSVNGNLNGKSTCQSVFLSIAKLKSICVLSLPKGIYSTNGISNGKRNIYVGEYLFDRLKLKYGCNILVYSSLQLHLVHWSGRNWHSLDQTLWKVIDIPYIFNTFARTLETKNPLV